MATESVDRWERLGPWLVWLVAVVAFTALAWPSWDTVVDDAYITARYAEQVASGNGFVYNAGQPAIEGFTNLGFVLLLAAGRLVGLPILPLMTTLGWAFAVLGMALAVLLTQQLAQDRGVLTGLPALILGLSPHLAVACTNGLESSMMMAATLAVLWSHLALQDGRRGWAGVLAGVLVCTRPEGLVVVGLVVLHDVWLHREDWRGALPLSGTAIGATLLLVLWRLVTYGDVVPNTFHAKSSFALLDTFKVNKTYLDPRMDVLTALAVAWFVATFLPPWRGPKLLVSVVALALGVIPLSVELWMPALRLFLPTIGLTAVLVSVVVVSARRPVALGAAAILLGAAAFLCVVKIDGERNYDGKHSVLPGNGSELAARYLGETLPPGEWLAIRDAGVFAYFIGPDVSVAELHQRALTQLHPEGKAAAFQEYTPANPAVFVGTVRAADDDGGFVYGNDRQVFSRLTVPYVYLGRVNQHYRRHYDVYARADTGITALPEGVVVNFKGPAPRLTPDAVTAPPPAEPLPDTGLPK